MTTNSGCNNNRRSTDTQVPWGETGMGWGKYCTDVVTPMADNEADLEVNLKIFFFFITLEPRAGYEP